MPMGLMAMASKLAENGLETKIVHMGLEEMLNPQFKIEDFLKRNKQHFKKGSVIVDCASVKVPVLDWFENHLPDDVYYIASHPLFGPDSARNKLRDNVIMVMPGKVPRRHSSPHGQ